MLCWLCKVLCLASISILVSATFAKQDEVTSWRDGLQHNAETVSHIEKFLHQSQKITSQAAEIRSILQFMKAMSESIQSQEQKAQTQNVDMMVLKSEIKAYAKRIKTLERKQRAQTQTIQSQAREIEVLRHQQAEKCVKADKNQGTDKEKKVVSRRILLHSDVDILSLVTTHSTDIKDLQNNMTKNNREIQSAQSEVASLKRVIAAKVRGSTYVRWGRKTCPSVNGTELVYSGFTGGSNYPDSGAASNYICLSPHPLWGHYNDAQDSDAAQVYGTEYEFSGGRSSQFFGTNLHDEDAPCSVCHSSRPTVLMIPGRNQCYPGWTLEYKGYLVAGHSRHGAASQYVCLDDQPEVLQSGSADKDGKLFYFVEGRCGSLPCKPYVDGRELTCVVCTK